MRHYSCDCCTRDFASEKEPRITIRLEIVPNQMTTELSESDLDQDQLDTMSDLLDELIETASDTAEIPVLGSKATPAKMEFDLCPPCFQRYIQDPLGRETARRMQFSKN